MNRSNGLEVAWFSALCDDDYEFLGSPDLDLQSSWAHCRNIVTTAETNGFDNVLLPSGYALGVDGVPFAGGIAAITEHIKLLLAVRCGEMWPPQLARQLAGLDEMLDGRLTVNIISSDLPGTQLASEQRYARTLEVMTILRTLLAGSPIDHHGDFYDISLEAPRIAIDRAETRRLGGLPETPPFYFGGLSGAARDVAAAAADVYLMWPDTMPEIAAIIADMRARAAAHGRILRFGYRAHVVVRDTEAGARAAAARLLSRLDAAEGEAIRNRSLDTTSAGVSRQAELRDTSDDDGFIEDHLWTGIARARSGCGAAIVGDPDQVVAKLSAYIALGIDSFILSGYPHLAECDLVAEHVLPALRHIRPGTA
ncbi:MAG TPA: LLM class flavin-dependent oxidoreductase [Ilumatobacteraceae bacterium]|nr:LLM class flavin-dependent oxidoreductase [Ilumatobacteraceae bacterium]